MKSFSVADRAKNLSLLESKKFDLVIVGGGINGAGAARDAALRGMSVALVEKGDFASGTSSRSSKLIHGGIRYLENLEFSLVFEALSERQKLFEIAPHLVHPLRFMLPLYQGGRFNMWEMGAGMWLYDMLSLFQAPELHERLSKQDSLRRAPELREQGLLGSYVYSDAYMDDDRLVFETLRSANSHGAVAVNYLKADQVELDAHNKVCAIQTIDQLTGNRHKIQGHHFLGTVGPWTDLLGHQWFADWNKTLRPTKGVHLTLLKKTLPLKQAVVMAAESRIVFAIPRHDMIIAGTTDTDFSGSPDAVKATQEDVHYLLKVLNQYFPGSAIQSTDIVATYAGVRPLVEDSSSSEGKTSREHRIFTEPHGVTFVAGGKYTTYRYIAEQVVDHCLHHFSIEDRVRFGHSRSLQPLNPLITEESWSRRDEVESALRKSTSLSDQEISQLSMRFGPEALMLVKGAKSGASYWEIEVFHAVTYTMCLHLVDFFARRTHLILSDPQHGLLAVEPIGQAFQSLLGWSGEQLARETKQLQEYLHNEFAWRNP